MKHLKMLGLAAVAAAALTAFVGAGTASATTLTGLKGAVLGTGSSIHGVSEGIVKWTTEFKNIECRSTLGMTTSNETGASVSGRVETLTLEECNCEAKVLKGGTLSIAWTSGSNGTVSSSGLEFTATCSTIFGNVHCIYVSNGSDLGTLTGGTTARLDITSGSIPRLPTSPLCGEIAYWDAIYKIDSPDTLNVIN